jgi:hypothetical protein
MQPDSRKFIDTLVGQSASAWVQDNGAWLLKLGNLLVLSVEPVDDRFSISVSGHVLKDTAPDLEMGKAIALAFAKQSLEACRHDLMAAANQL